MHDAGTPPLELQDASVRFATRSGEPPREVIRHLSLRVGAGRIVGVCGPNGAGKTTLLELCAGEVEQSEGRVAWFGRVRHDDDLKRRIGYLSAETALPQRLTAHEALRMLAGLDGLGDAQADERILPLAARLGVGEAQLAERVERLSPDVAARLGVVQALLPERELLLCDGTLGAFDLETQIELRKLLHEHADRGVAVLLTSADPSELAGTADEIHVMHDGRFVRRFGPSALVANLLLRLDVRPLEGDYLAALRARFPDVWLEGHIAHVPWIADRFDAIAFRLTLPAPLARVSIVSVDEFSVRVSYEALVR
jgi:ABC-type multidrug transport system ATPase subunit